MKKIMMTAIVATMILSVSALGQLITNGDFESGDTGFTSDYTPVSFGKPPDQDLQEYSVGTSPFGAHQYWEDYGDNTSGSGNMLIVNGAAVADQVVWEQTGIAVVAGTEYTLTYYLSSSYSTNLASIQCSIEGDVSGSTTLGTQAAPGTTGSWLEVSYTWTAGASDTSATITLEDMTLEADGDDFAIDDISLEAVPASIEKEMEDPDPGDVEDPDVYELGEHVTITLTVDNPHASSVTVEDVLPDGLAYIPGSLVVDGGPVVPTVDGSTISFPVDSGDDIEITFDVQVVEVQCELVENLENTANVYPPGGGDPDDTAVVGGINLLPYEGFSKDIAASTEGDPYYVPMHTDVHWLLLIQVQNIGGDEIVDMEDVVVKDNLGGDLEMHLCYSGCDDYNGKVLLQPPSQTPTVAKQKGKTKKLQLSWDLDDLGDEAFQNLYLEISTDTNPGHGKPGKVNPKNEYTSEGDHDLNSGATLKFTDPDTTLQLSAHTCPITVEAYDPGPP